LWSGASERTRTAPHWIKAATFGRYAQLTRAVADGRGEPKNSAITAQSAAAFDNYGKDECAFQ